MIIKSPLPSFEGYLMAFLYLYLYLSSFTFIVTLGVYLCS